MKIFNQRPTSSNFMIGVTQKVAQIKKFLLRYSSNWERNSWRYFRDGVIFCEVNRKGDTNSDLGPSHK